MGREAVVQAEVAGQTAEVRALLETGELILRGRIRRRYPRAALQKPRVAGDMLCFTADGEAVRLHLGARVAEAWRKAIAAPPPSLRAKLGLDKGAKALRVGACDDDALKAALDGVTVRAIKDADMVVACVESGADLDRALAAQAARGELPLWAVYPKGKGAAFGDSQVRAVLRAAGFRDTKACAVSERLTATRYNRAKD